MYQLTCQRHHPDDTLVILPFMGHMYFKQQPHTGYCIKTQWHFNLSHLFHQTMDGNNDGPPPLEFFIKPTPAWFGTDGKWLSVSWEFFAPSPYFVAEHLWPRLITGGVQWMQRRRRRIVARRILGPLSEFVRLAVSRLPWDAIELIIKAALPSSSPSQRFSSSD
jgi:hypothetical protein